MSDVFWCDMSAQYGNSIENKLKKLTERLDLKGLIGKDELVAVKIHVGERGNLGYVNHNFVRVIVDAVKAAGGKPYLTDTNTLYSGGRHNGLDHALTAIHHGFTYESTGAPFIPADGLRGLEYLSIAVPGKHLREAKLAPGVLNADKVVFVSHFKGHFEAGFGGCVKGMAMGCATAAGKMDQHCNSKPKVKAENCIACRQCFRACPQSAIRMVEKKAVIDYDKCIGCGQCVAACNYDAMNPEWGIPHLEFIERLAEYAFAVDSVLKDKSAHFCFGTNVTPDCDCWGANDTPLVEDVGIFASRNPLACDKALFDLVNQARRNVSSRFYEKTKQTEDLFRGVYPEIESTHLFSYLESLGMSSTHRLQKIE